jgi:hypothetical protein
MNKILKRFRQEIELMYMMAKKSKLPGLPLARVSWSLASGCLFPVVRLPVARLPVVRLPVARLPVVRLPVIWLPTSAKKAQNKLQFSSPACARNIPPKKEDISSSHWDRLPGFPNN